MTMKKKLLTTMSVVLILGMAALGILAYLQSEDSDVNVMTLGNVEIEQIEQEYDANGKLVAFNDGKQLYPYVGTVAWDIAKGDAYRQFTMKNVVDKYVSVKNIGKSDAYVRTWLAFEMGDCTEAEFDQMVGISQNAENGSEFQFPGAWNWTNVGKTNIFGNDYYIMYATHKDAVEPNETTIPSLLQVYMSKEATNETVAKLDGNDSGKYEILAFSQAVQTAGFENADAALKEAFGLDHPWTSDPLAPNEDTTAPSISIAQPEMDHGYFSQTITVTNVEDVDYPLTISVYGLSAEDEDVSSDTLRSVVTINENDNIEITSGIGLDYEVRGVNIDSNEKKIIIDYNCAPPKRVYLTAVVTDAAGNANKVDEPLHVNAAVGCFVAGTKIQTVDGLVNIEDIQVGDKVYSINLLTGKKVVNTVSWVQERRYNDETYTIYTGEEKIVTTYEHPFYVDGKGWTAAEKLKVGNKLRLMDGTNIEIDKIVRTELDKPVQVYNFTVEGTHNYLITETGILVHNVQK